MFMPVDPGDRDGQDGQDGRPDDAVAVDKKSKAERKKRREQVCTRFSPLALSLSLSSNIIITEASDRSPVQEKRIARKKVTEAVTHWERFFAKNDKYFKVGIVKREVGWVDRLPQRELCEAARKARPSRSH